jgi:transcriptional regulator with XRE-family HTH domain
MSVDISTIAGRLRKARLEKRLSQTELAQKLGVTQGTVSRAEQGRGDLRVGTLLEIARALDLDIVLAPRRLRSTIDHLIDGLEQRGLSSVYTGRGDEPYTESDDVP